MTLTESDQHKIERILGEVPTGDLANLCVFVELLDDNGILSRLIGVVFNDHSGASDRVDSLVTWPANHLRLACGIPNSGPNKVTQLIGLITQGHGLIRLAKLAETAGISVRDGRPPKRSLRELRQALRTWSGNRFSTLEEDIRSGQLPVTNEASSDGGR